MKTAKVRHEKIRHNSEFYGKQYFPAYGGYWAGEFPHICVCTRTGNLVLQRIHFHPDNFESAWNEAAAICDQLNNELD